MLDHKDFFFFLLGAEVTCQFFFFFFKCTEPETQSGSHSLVVAELGLIAFGGYFLYSTL